MQTIYKKCTALFLSIMLLLSGVAAFNVSAETVSIDFETKTDTLLLVDMNTDEVVFEKNADVVRAPASVTKVMTYIVVAEQIEDLENTKVKIKSEVLKELEGTGSSVAGLVNHIGEEFSVLELLYAMMIPSGSDAALVLADFAGGSIDRFTEMMNEKAKELGCENTNFVNSYGLAGNDHYTTAYDLYKISKYALTLPYFEEVVNTTSYTLKGDTVPLFTTNYLIDRVNGGQYYYQYAKGIKTGFTDEAGKCLVSTAQKGESKYMCIALHAEADTVNNAMLDSKNLYEWAFNNLTENINISVDTRFKSVQVGEKIQVTARIDDASEEAHITWTSSNPQAATVDQNGVVTGVSMGETQIKAETQTGNFDICSVSCGYYSGIDVSSRYGDYTNGEKEPVNWELLKKQGIDFAIIRAGWGWEDYPTQNDADFTENVKNAVNSGIPFGINFISYAYDKESAKLEAEYLLKELKEYIPEYAKYMALPIAYNMYDRQFETFTPEQNNEIALEFAGIMKENGYNTMIYADKAVFLNMNLSEIKDKGIGLWYAYYPYEVDFSEKITIPGTNITPDVWQYRTDWYLPFASENGYARQSLIYMLSSVYERYAPPAVEISNKEGEKSVDISWEPVSYETSGYNVYRTPYTAYGDIDMAKLEKIAAVDSNTTSYTDNDLEWYDSYYYFVSATVTETDFLNKTYTKEVMSTDKPYAYIKNPSPDFESIEELEEALNKIFRANETEIVRMIKEQRKQSVEDKYVTLYSNCGPASVAFQKVLADHGIYAEDRSAPYLTMGYGGHEYNLIRVNFGGNKDKVYNIIADCTYRQFMRTYFSNALAEKSGVKPTDNQIDFAMLNSQLPMVLAYEYGDCEGLDIKINGLLSESGYTTGFLTERNLMGAYERFTYPDQVLQKNYSKYISNRQMAQLRNNGLLNKPYETALYINNSADNTNTAELEYKENGIYQCSISLEDLGIQKNEDFAFTITDENGNTVYGASEADETLTPFISADYSYMTFKPQIFLSDSSNESIKANIGYFEKVIIRVDERAGIDKPLISMFGVYDIGIYGDADNDKTVTIKDVALIQMYLADLETNLTKKDLIAANVIESDNIDIRSAAAVQIYLANLQNESKTGEKFYMLDSLDIDYIN